MLPIVATNSAVAPLKMATFLERHPLQPSATES
jgi:hypothetical protein